MLELATKQFSFNRWLRQESEFKRFVLRVIAEQLPRSSTMSPFPFVRSPQQSAPRDSKTEQAVEKAFRCLDRNGDGVLTVEEAQQLRVR